MKPYNFKKWLINFEQKWQLWPKNVIIQTLQSLYNFISTLVSEDNVLDAEKAFVTLSYLNILRMPLGTIHKWCHSKNADGSHKPLLVNVESTVI